MMKHAGQGDLVIQGLTGSAPAPRGWMCWPWTAGRA